MVCKAADNPKVKEFLVGQRRHVVWPNSIKTAKDFAAREAILTNLRKMVSEGALPQPIISN